MVTRFEVSSSRAAPGGTLVGVVPIRAGSNCGTLSFSASCSNLGNFVQSTVNISFRNVHDGWRQLFPGWKSLEKATKRSFARLPIHKLKIKLSCFSLVGYMWPFRNLLMDFSHKANHKGTTRNQARVHIRFLCGLLCVKSPSKGCEKATCSQPMKSKTVLFLIYV